MNPQRFKFLLAFLLMLVSASFASAAEAAPLRCAGYWAGFVEFWKSSFAKQDTVVVSVLGAGAIGIFIITRGKWKK